MEAARFGEDYRSYANQNSDRKNHFYLELIRSHLDNTDPVSLLDIGCGLGAFLRFVSEHQPTWELTGTEISTYALSQAQALLPEVNILDASTLETSEGLGNHDIITAWDVIEHVEDRDGFARTVRSALNPSGLFAFVVPVYDGLTGPVVTALDRDPTHIHKYGRADWLGWARRNFIVQSWTGVFRLLLPWGLYPHFSTRRLRFTSPAIAVVCRPGI